MGHSGLTPRLVRRWPLIENSSSQGELVRTSKIVLIALLVLSLTNVFAAPSDSRQKAGAQPEPAGESWVETTLRSLSLDEKIGQLIIPATVGMFLTENNDAYRQMRRDITEFHVGGYHLLGDVNAMHEPAGVALMLNRLQETVKVPLWFTADFEGGVGYRFIGATRLPRAMAMGATGDPELAFQAGRITAEEARAIGIHVNFYPVVDVNNNPRNPIINIRSFGGDPQLVSKMARGYIRGAQSAGVMATAKHFPGHGDTATDSHMELPTVDIDRARLDAIELPPFRAAIEEGVGGVMSAHIALPRIETQKLPATLSPKMLTGVLRNEMHFNGVIFTDALNMRGVAAHYPEGEAAVRALEAGADILLYPPSVEQAFNAVKHALETGQIKESRIDESVRRVLAAKQHLGLDKNRFADLNKLSQVLGSRKHQETAQRIIDSAVTLVRDDKKALPLKLAPEQKVLFVTLVDNHEGWQGSQPGSAFLQGLMKRHAKTTSAYVSERTSPAEFELIKKLASFADVVIVNGFIRVAAYKGSIDLSESEIDLLKFFSAIDKPFVFVLYGSPYMLSFVPELPSYILTYEYYPAAEEAALKAVLGEIEFKGRLPIELPGLYPIGHGMTMAGAR
jgi:beta-N-acetylhexosaminidase